MTSNQGPPDGDKLSPGSARDRRRKAAARMWKYAAGGLPPRGQVPIKSNHSWRMSVNHYKFPVESRQGEPNRMVPMEGLFVFLRERFTELDEQYANAPDVYRSELATIAANRAVVDHLERTLAEMWKALPPPWSAIKSLQKVGLLIAEQYADHPDYRKGYRP